MREKRWAVEPYDDLNSKVSYKTFDRTMYAQCLLMNERAGDRKFLAMALRSMRVQCETHRRLREKGLVK